MKARKSLFKLAILAILCINLVTMGCAAVQKISCNPPDSVIAVANAVIAMLLPELNILVPGSGAFDAYITAQNIAAGICISATQLENLITWLQSKESQVAQTRTMVKAGPMKAKAINIQPLLDWRDGK